MAAQEKDIEQMSLGDLVSSLKPKQLWGALTALVVLISAIATLAFKLGGL